MQYRKDRHSEDLSVLGYGCMRFTKKGNSIDIDKAEKEILLAIELGVNYFDTAYLYPGSEAALGKIFERNNIRDKVKIATKLPQYLTGSRDAADRFFNEELSRLRTSFVDYYLMHHMTDVAQWTRLKNLGIEQWIEEKKQSGQIKNIGFSYHGNCDGFIEILNDYDWDFCQIQYNYLDEFSQAGVRGLKAAYEKGIPVIIMEPLRGGQLSSMLPQNAKDEMEKSGRGWSPASWAFRWLYNQPEVTVVLSGMNSIEMVTENCETAHDAYPGSLSDKDMEVIEKVKNEIQKKNRVSCTGCRYCMPCPAGVDIPGAFFFYNMMYINSKGEGRYRYAQNVALRKDPPYASLCTECGKCEKRCPQEIPVREKLKEADRALRPLPYKIGINVARKFMTRKAGKKA